MLNVQCLDPCGIYDDGLRPARGRVPIDREGSPAVVLASTATPRRGWGATTPTGDPRGNQQARSRSPPAM